MGASSQFDAGIGVSPAAVLNAEQETLNNTGDRGDPSQQTKMGRSDFSTLMENENERHAIKFTPTHFSPHFSPTYLAYHLSHMATSSYITVHQIQVEL
jgi:hypothetical protein